jgi:mRNA-degrading endonuclease YafQ of YafQ-DinJ toxin-antitoxin module
MKIIYHKRFEKNFTRLPQKLRTKVVERIELFKKDQFNPVLKNHALKGPLSDRRAFSVTGDIRIIFEEFDNYFVVVMLDVGIHNQIY